MIVWKLDRLGRSVKNLVDLVGELHNCAAQFQSLTEPAWLKWKGN